MEPNEKPAVYISLRIDRGIRDLALQVANAQGRDMSEYLRALIIADLDDRGLIVQRMRSTLP